MENQKKYFDDRYLNIIFNKDNFTIHDNKVYYRDQVVYHSTRPIKEHMEKHIKLSEWIKNNLIWYNSDLDCVVTDTGQLNKNTKTKTVAGVYFNTSAGKMNLMWPHVKEFFEYYSSCQGNNIQKKKSIPKSEKLDQEAITNDYLYALFNHYDEVSKLTTSLSINNDITIARWILDQKLVITDNIIIFSNTILMNSNKFKLEKVNFPIVGPYQLDRLIKIWEYYSKRYNDFNMKLLCKNCNKQRIKTTDLYCCNCGVNLK